ncbi:N-methylhydantoinase A/oxoprolinase/acetone carboxylase beta subunit (plasmid) [Ensifer sp. WSM1721]
MGGVTIVTGENAVLLEPLRLGEIVQAADQKPECYCTSGRSAACVSLSNGR